MDFLIEINLRMCFRQTTNRCVCAPFLVLFPPWNPPDIPAQGIVCALCEFREVPLLFSQGSGPKAYNFLNLKRDGNYYSE